MNTNPIKDFLTNFHLLTVAPPCIADLTHFDFTAYATTRQILAETEGGKDE